MTAIAGAGCVSNAAGDRPNLLTAEEEKRFGEEMAVEIEKQEKVLDDVLIQEYVDRIGERLARQSPRQDVNYSFEVIDSPDVVNAFALPGGRMYIYTGLMHLCSNEAELASVMAHEIAHVAAEHHGEALTRQYGLEILLSIALGESVSTGAQLARVATGLQSLSYNRAQEREADNIGMEILWRAGYRPDAMVSFMEKMAEGQGDPGRLYFILSSHPATMNRIGDLRLQLNRYPEIERANSPVYAERYQTNVLERLPAP